MAEEVISTTPAPAAENTPAIAPAAGAVSQETVSPDPTILGSDPVVETVPANTEDPAKTDEKPVEPEKVPEVVAEPEKPAEIKTDEAPKVEGEQPKTEEVKTELVLPTYEALVLPEDTKISPERIAEVDSMFGNFENVSKADHAEDAKFRQAMVDYHIASVNETVNAFQAAYQESWKNQTAKWRKDFEADPEYGGNRKDTTVAAANEFISTHGGTTEQQKEFRDLMNTTGLGNHPAVIRTLANANLAHSEGRPLPGTRPAAAATSKLEKWYGKK